MRLSSGIVISLGHNVASVAPVWKGVVLRDYVYRLDYEEDILAKKEKMKRKKDA